uniref:(northern house mosquito) hypothetical protein n=1 Tax=Culex pipiens TaxID=7175 RepID=A0A8D8F8V6_CULPI
MHPHCNQTLIRSNLLPPLVKVPPEAQHRLERLPAVTLRIFLAVLRLAPVHQLGELLPALTQADRLVQAVHQQALLVVVVTVQHGDAPYKAVRFVIFRVL